MTPILDLLFVYGTLLSGSDHPMARHLASVASLLGPARIPGRLYYFGSYPGAIHADDPADRILGEIWRLDSPDRTLPQLDRYEGCTPGSGRPYLFVREPVTATLSDDSLAQCWTYWFAGDLNGAQRLACGDYRTSPHFNSVSQQKS